ncbi:MAPEG family protein [Nodosilinea sp. E11]|uniref:MAPEG family protein n=1 Tax=Nodosilinea sp. E11 TaxID=3037479 RepID=UPI0029342CAE|nr:MAPEG family protein [Nodosilinea sp. E11]WOD39398.1 MAPEG family protein [Nodosilinea sp. E11]
MDTLQLWLLCTVFLAAKMWANSLVQGYCRLHYRQFVNPEDACWAGQVVGHSLPPVSQDHPLVERAARCWRNDLENIPMFLLVALGYGLVGGDRSWGAVYLGTFAIARVLHTLCYLAALQPWRFLAYLLGVGVMGMMAAHSIHLALAL